MCACDQVKRYPLLVTLDLYKEVPASLPMPSLFPEALSVGSCSIFEPPSRVSSFSNQTLNSAKYFGKALIIIPRKLCMFIGAVV
jgi:hypothetical protein